MESPIVETTVGPTTNGQLETVQGAIINEEDGRPIAPMPQFDNMSIGGGILAWKQQPVHETMTLAALIASDMKLDPRMTYDKAIDEYQYDTLEYLRGVVWNDDPSNFLFNNHSTDNFNRGIGAEWGGAFAAGKFLTEVSTKESRLGRTNMIVRSHFGDLQFLHSMADKTGEKPEETHKKILVWLEVMYKVAIGQISKDTKLRDVQLPRDNEQDRYPLRRLFTDYTFPSDTDTIHTLLTSNHAYPNVKHDRRALGSCLHVIQDSFARGHCHRRIQFNENPKQFSEIKNFHSYKGQDAHKHAGYDFNHHDMSSFNCADISQFKNMDGCTDAIIHCTKLINFWKNRTPWEENVWAWLANDVFQVAFDATPSNTEVNEDD